MPKRNIRSDLTPGFSAATERGVEKANITRRLKRLKVTIPTIADVQQLLAKSDGKTRHSAKI